jgi:hypothetical protein
MDIEFTPFQKIPRLKRLCVVTEKIDGTNAAVRLVPGALVTGEPLGAIDYVEGNYGAFWVFAQSRSRFVTPTSDNHGFAAWVVEHSGDLSSLGEGIHYGEWWGQGIQRRYGLREKRFSLFNVSRWGDEVGGRPECCHVVPVLYRGVFDTAKIDETLDNLGRTGSVAAPGFMTPEGIVIYHAQSGALFKKTFQNDENGKEKKRKRSG